MASFNPPKKNTAYRMFVGLRSQADTRLFQVNPTLASGDAKVSKDGGALSNLATLPAVIGSSAVVQIDLSSTEMNADNVTILLSDAAGGQWCDLIINLQTAALQFDDQATAAAVADAVWDEARSGHTGAGSFGEGVVVNSVASGAITAAAVATGAIDADALAADAGTEIATAVWANGSRTLTSSSDPTAAAIADAVWDEARSGHVGAGSFGEGVVVNSIASGAITAAAVATGAIDADALAADAGTEIGTAVWANGSRTLTSSSDPTAAAIADAVWDEAIAGHVAAGTFGAETQSHATPAEVNAEVVDALSIDAYAEPGSVPAATSSLKDKIGWMFTMMRNKRITTSTADRVRNDADSADIGVAVLSEDGGTFTSGEFS